MVVHEEVESPKSTRKSRPSLNDGPSLCATLYTAGGFASSTSGDQHFYEIITLHRPPPHQDWGRLASPVMAKFWAPSWGGDIPEERPREPTET
jgi:hypothetical protein